MSKSKIKVPKRVAGVKIPKSVRKGPVLQFVNSSAGKLLVAQALTAALGVFAYKTARGPTGEKLKLKAKDAEESLKHNTARLTYAFGEGVRAFREALEQPGEQPTTIEGEVAESRAEEMTAPAAKKNYRRSPEVQSGL
jgi:hypothetical protein